MKILFYLLRGSGGGAGNICFLLKILAETFPEDEYHVVTASHDFFQKVATLPNVHIHIVPSPVHLEWTRFTMGYLGIKKYCKKIKPDIIWTVNGSIYTKLPVPVVLTMNNPHLISEWEEIKKFHKGHLIKLAVMRYFFKRTLQNSSHVIVQTDMVKDRIEKFCRKQKKITTIPKAVDSQNDVTFAPLLPEQEKLFQGGLGNDTFTFLFVSNYYPHKNHRILISTIKQLQQKNEQVRIALTLSRDDLKIIGGDLALELADQGYILPLGWIDKEQLKTLYDRCNACVMPSELECLSSAHIEAMSWQKPQICVDMPYAHAVCKEAALYVNPHDVNEWEQAMLQLRDDNALCDDLAQKGLRVMNECFPKSWGDMAKQVRQIFLQELTTQSK